MAKKKTSTLIFPYGGRLVDLMVPAEAAGGLKGDASHLPSLSCLVGYFLTVRGETDEVGQRLAPRHAAARQLIVLRGTHLGRQIQRWKGASSWWMHQ